jgi:hypothetical protein
MTLVAWISAMFVNGIFVHHRGWENVAPWLRRYVWCAIIVAAIMFLPLVTGYFPAGPLLYPFFGLMYAYMILLWLGIATGIVLLAIMPIPSASA